MSILRTTAWILLLLVAGGAASMAAAYLYLQPQIPPAESYRALRLETPLRIFTADGRLAGEFGERRLIPIRMAAIPPLFIKAVIDTEDKRFYDHAGVDFLSMVNVLREFLVSGGDYQRGASTITMQLARNISFSPERTALRKLKEVLLALQIERELSKDEILELYLNVVPFGKRAYGAQAAALTYYGQPLDRLELPQWAMLAGIPQRPSAANPVNSPDAARERRNLVLRRMLEAGSIDQGQYETALQAPINARVYTPPRDVDAQYAAEIARQQMHEKFGADTYTRGLEVDLTVDSRLQEAATRAVRAGILAYDRRHGWRGAETHLGGTRGSARADWLEHLQTMSVVGGLEPAVVTGVQQYSLSVLRQDGSEVTLGPQSYAWAARYVNFERVTARPTFATEVVRTGDVVRLRSTGPKRWQLAQLPKVQAALVAISPLDGAVLAMVGGFDFGQKQFNHATQAGRQPGSGFKPFVYSAALDRGVTPSTIFMDSPLVLRGEAYGETYRPQNFGGSYHGPTRVREALYKSINLVSMRIVLKIGGAYTRTYVGKFGFDTRNFPQDVQLGVGGGTIGISPLDMARAYSVFANGGFLITPHVIRRARVAGTQQVAWAPDVKVACPTCFDPPARRNVLPHLLTEAELNPPKPPPLPPNVARRAISARNAYVMNSMLQDVVSRGTAARASGALPRKDIYGKTGTTNEADTWFNGYTPGISASVWLGFSDSSPIGSAETGTDTALPIWIDFMKTALDGVPEATIPEPPGILRIPSGGREEVYMAEFPPGFGGGGGESDEATAGPAAADIF